MKVVKNRESLHQLIKNKLPDVKKLSETNFQLS